MNRPEMPVPLRSFEELAEARELRSVISSALASTPVDEHALRCAVWSFVGAERASGVPPAVVITRLTDLVEAANITPSSGRLQLTRRVILWCVEEYFGHLGGDVLSVDSPRGAAAAPPSA